MENKNNNTILIILLVIFMLSTLSLGGYIIYDKSINKQDTNKNEITDNDNNLNNSDTEINQEEKNYLIIPIVNEITNYLSENSIICYMEFENPEKVLEEDNIYISYVLQTSDYTTKAPEGYMNHFAITIENIKKYLKEKFNHDYSNSEIKEYFKDYYDEKTKTLIIPSSGGITPPIIEKIYEKNGEYHIELIEPFETNKKRTIVLKQENDKFYFYSSTGLN